MLLLILLYIADDISKIDFHEVISKLLTDCIFNRNQVATYKSKLLIVINVQLFPVNLVRSDNFIAKNVLIDTASYQEKTL